MSSAASAAAARSSCCWRPNVLTLLRAGREANVLFQIYDENGQPTVVGVPFSLLGFTAALNEVMT